MSTDLIRHRREFARAVANHKYERTDAGLFFPEQKAFAGGMLASTVNGEDLRVDANTFTVEGLNYLLTAGVKNGGAVAAFYLAPFSGNVNPTSALTAANFNSTQTEFTNYTEAARPEFVDGAVSAGSLSNSASRAEITAGTGGGNVWGAGLLSIATKSSTSGTLLACAKFGAVRALLETDVLAFQYTLTLTPA